MAIAALQSGQLEAQLAHTPLGNGELRTERVAAAALASGNELENTLESATGVAKLRLLRTAKLRDIAGHASNLGSNTVKGVADHTGLQKSGAKSSEENALNERATNRQAVVTKTPAGGMTTVVTAAFSAHEPHPVVAMAAVKHAIEKVSRINVRTRPLGTAVSAASALGPRPSNLAASLPRRIPQSRRNDSEGLVDSNEMLADRLDEDVTMAGTWITPGAGTVPGPAANVLLAMEDAGNRG